MLRKWHIAITLVGVIAVLLAGAWFYYVYAPPPVVMVAAGGKAPLKPGAEQALFGSFRLA